MRRIIKLGFIFFFVFALGIFGIYGYLIHWGTTGGPNTQEVEIIIERGSSAHQIGRELKKYGVISSSFLFFSYLRLLTQQAKKLQSGDYLIPPHTTPERIIYMLDHGLQREFKFTIPEGSNQKEIVEIIAQTGLSSREALEQALQNPLLHEEFKIPPELKGGVEGYLFPDTYIFQAGTLPLTIFRHMHEELNKHMTPEMQKRMQEIGYSLNEVLTFASLIEKETANSKERPLIASVFYNRLRRGMKLQTDPTVIYGIKRRKGKILKRDLSNKHEYNTYLHAGLPPGPIASPGLAAINAVLWPARTNYLYFVSKNNGTHEFCPNYACHVRAIQTWQKSAPTHLDQIAPVL